LNEVVGGDTYIDLYARKGDPLLRLVVFGSNSEERAIAVKILLGRLPDAVQLVQEEDPYTCEKVKALLHSLRAEASALKRHRSNQDVRPEVVTEMMRLQMSTDGLASGLKRRCN